MTEFLMPALGADMEKGRLVQWLVQPGGRVKPGDVVAVVETQKGAIDVEIFLEGYIEDLVPLGTELPVGGVLARVRQEGEAAAPPAAAAGRIPEVAPVVTEHLAPGPAPAVPTSTPAAPPAIAPALHAAGAMRTRVRAAPGARRRAQELGLDPAALAALTGSGPEHSIVLADVERAANARPGGGSPAGTAPAPEVRRGFDTAQMRSAIAAAMTRSMREIPHYFLSQTVDFSAAQAWLDAYNAEKPPAQRLLAAALLLKASAQALRAVPQLNGFYRDGAVQLSPSIHIGWAVSLRGGGLVVPAIHDTDKKALPDAMVAIMDVVQRARSGGLRSSEFSDGTVTVTSLGDRGADSVYGIIYPPQLAVIGFGKVSQRPWAVNGQVVARPLVEVTLAADHRASDGHVGGRLLAAIDAALQQPQAL